MKSSTGMPSLRPYLEPNEGRSFLRISYVPQTTSAQGQSRFPFLVIDESHPLSRLIEAHFATDAGSNIKRVFVLMQKDEYQRSRDELPPINNHEVDACWQKAFSFYSQEVQDDSIAVLANQISEDGGLSSLQSLFFCTEKQRFFHPLCPKCGSPVQQCYDDDLLSGLGLQPYSTSLKRYLFCPSCLSSRRRSPFYTYLLEPSDPPALKDQGDLVKELALLVKGRNQPSELPCIECPNQEECYMSDCLAVSRIVPFSFYPFYMLIFEAMSLNAYDFLSLISGDSLEDLENRLNERQESGRIGCLKTLKQEQPVTAPLFFGRDERYFSEVLYLKLSFLRELARAFLAGLNDYQYLDLGLSLDRIWIKLTGQGSLLPFLWNFKVKVIDIGGNVGKTPALPKSSPQYGLHFLGLVWFDTLLVNKNQSVSEVRKSLGQAMERTSSNGDAVPESLPSDGFNAGFSWKNIFWNPESQKKQPMPESWERLWRLSLDLGWSLLRASVNWDSKWSTDEFQQRLENLREEIRNNLFRPVSALDPAEIRVESQVIHDILLKLIDRWRITPEGKKHKYDEGDLAKTSVETTERARLDDTRSASRDDEDLTETVILSSEDLRRDDAQDREAGQTREMAESDLPETIVMAPPEDSCAPPRSTRQLSLENLRHERRASPLERPVDTPERRKATPEDSNGDDCLAQTVVLSPNKGKTKE